MKFCILGSGSKGNSVYVEARDGSALLIDAGFSGKELISRLGSRGLELTKVGAVFVTHEHEDHIRGVGIIARKAGISTYANQGTYRGCERRIGKLPDQQEFNTGETVVFQGLSVRSFPTSHDTNDPVGFVVSDGRQTLGYCTDTGKISHLITARLQGCDALIVEFNHDLEMLKNGPYPLPLQQRVRSNMGHLCNEDGAELFARAMGPRLQLLMLAHLSEANNSPQLALAAARKTVPEPGDCRLCIAPQHEASALIDLEMYRSGG